METIILAFSVVTFIVLLVVSYWLYQQSQSASKIDQEQVVKDVTERVVSQLTEKENEFNEKILARLADQEKKLSQNLQDNQHKMESKLQENITQIKNQFEKQLQEQKSFFENLKLQNQNHFEDLSQKNQQRLSQLEKSVREELRQGITQLTEVNKKELQNIQQSTNEQLKLLSKSSQERLNQINEDVQKRLDENFAQNLKSVKEVNEKLGHIQSTANKMIESTKSVDKLNQIFARTSSKAFGDFGEKYLESLLSKHLEENSWAKQVKPPGSSDKIDFVIYLADKKIGIDAKFPVTRYQDYLEAEPEQQKTKLKEYLRGVMQMAYDISHKYYKESFLDNLFLYVPSEGMYSEIVKSPEVMDYLQQMKVTLTSPNTVFPLIMVVQSYQFKAKVSQNAESIISGLKSISQNVQGFREEFRKLGDKIRQSQQNYDKAESNLLGVERQVMLLESGHSAEQVSGDSQESNQADTLM